MELIPGFTQAESLLLGITLITCLITLAYRFWLMKPIRYTKAPAQEPLAHQEPVSVILYANNQADMLTRCLPVLLTQDYPLYEVIVVNDGTNNETEDVLKRFAFEYPHLYHTYIPQEARYLSRKKLALTVGIKAAKYRTLLFTEPYCCPTSNRWIQKIVGCYGENVKFVTGYTGYFFTGNLYQKMIAYRFLSDGIRDLSLAIAGSMFRGNEENQSYRREQFTAHQGFRNHLNLAGGENDLFVHEYATVENTAVCYVPDGQTRYLEPLSPKEWRRKQAERLASRQFYRGYSPIIARLEIPSLSIYLVATTASIVLGLANLNGWLLAAVLSLYALLYGCKWYTFRKAVRLLQAPSIEAWIPILDIVQLFDRIYIHIYFLFHKNKSYTCRIGRKRNRG